MLGVRGEGHVHVGLRGSGLLPVWPRHHSRDPCAGRLLPAMIMLVQPEAARRTTRPKIFWKTPSSVLEKGRTVEKSGATMLLEFRFPDSRLEWDGIDRVHGREKMGPCAKGSIHSRLLCRHLLKMSSHLEAGAAGGSPPSSSELWGAINCVGRSTLKLRQSEKGTRTSGL